MSTDLPPVSMTLQSSKVTAIECALFQAITRGFVARRGLPPRDRARHVADLRESIGAFRTVCFNRAVQHGHKPMHGQIWAAIRALNDLERRGR